MLDFSAYLAAQQITRDAVSDALADPPVSAARRPEAIAVRQWLSLTRRRLAQMMQIAPMPERAGSPLPAGR